MPIGGVGLTFPRMRGSLAGLDGHVGSGLCSEKGRELTEARLRGALTISLYQPFLSPLLDLSPVTKSDIGLLARSSNYGHVAIQS